MHAYVPRPFGNFSKRGLGTRLACTVVSRSQTLATRDYMHRCSQDWPSVLHHSCNKCQSDLYHTTEVHNILKMNSDVECTKSHCSNWSASSLNGGFVPWTIDVANNQKQKLKTNYPSTNTIQPSRCAHVVARVHSTIVLQLSLAQGYGTPGAHPSFPMQQCLILVSL